MKIIIKVLGGQQCTLEVPGNTTVLKLKEMIFGALKIPVTQQKLLITGRLLTDDKRLSDYPNICDGVRVHLFVSKTLDGANSTDMNCTSNSAPSGSTPKLIEATYNFLNKYYSDQDSRKIADEFMKEFNRSVASLSLDDIERIAKMYLDDESSMMS